LLPLTLLDKFFSLRTIVSDKHFALCFIIKIISFGFSQIPHKQTFV
jgi:hypothetical protein